MRTLYVNLRPHLFFILLFLLTLVLVAGVAAKKQKGPHGGAIKIADNYFIEMKHVDSPGSLIPQKLIAYLLDKKMKAFSNKEVSGDVNFLFPDGIAHTVPLKPEQDDAFACEAPADYATCKITFNLEGKLIAAEFSNPVRIARKK